MLNSSKKSGFFTIPAHFSRFFSKKMKFLAFFLTEKGHFLCKNEQKIDVLKVHFMLNSIIINSISDIYRIVGF